MTRNQLRLWLLFLSAVVVTCAAGCTANPEQKGGTAPGGVHVAGVELDGAGATTSTTTADQPVQLALARNEWTGFSLQLTGLPPVRPSSHAKRYSLRLRLPNDVGDADVAGYQVVAMPVDMNRAGFVRHTGLTPGTGSLPRALLPLSDRSADGRISLTALRDPYRATDPIARPTAAQPLTLWVDLHIPADAKAGDYQATCEILADAPTTKARGRASAPPVIVASTPVKLTVYDFALPDERHLSLVSPVDWSTLRRLYPLFESVEPRLLNRMDPRYAQSIRVLDQLMRLAQAHRTQVMFPRLQPTVKWPTSKPPEVDWVDYDALVWPWMKGDSFADRQPVSFWPLPSVDFLYNYPQADQLRYWSEAASHFDQLNWLERSSAVLNPDLSGRAGALQSVRVSAEAARLLSIHPRLRVTVPLEPGQVQLASESRPQFVTTTSAARLMAVAPALVSPTPTRDWPSDAPPPQRWLRTDLSGLVPWVGAGGDEHDVRLWAWLAYLRGAEMVRLPDALPQNATPQEPADPNELVWFYPGSWFGVDEPVPTLQLKWLRRAQQDYEYLWLARQRGQTGNAELLARLIAKPVEVQPNQPDDPTYTMMCGTTDADAWTDARRLLAQNIQLREPGRAPDPQREAALGIETMHWMRSQEHPTLLARTTQWTPTTPANPALVSLTGNPQQAMLRLGIDVYNASDTRPVDSTLRFTSHPAGWDVREQPISIPSLARYAVRQFYIDAKVDAARVNNADHRPVELTFTQGYDNRKVPVRVILPTATSDRLPPSLNLDGSLDDWSADDAIQDGPMVQMLSRPAVQGQQPQMATTPSSVYTGWSDDSFYVGFKVSGVARPENGVARNFVSYQFRRAWGEDLCQLLIQPVYADGGTGATLHIVCKPNGTWVERKGDPRTDAAPDADAWTAVGGTPARYYATVAGATWRGELAIPWRAITDDLAGAGGTRGRPTMLRFNFVQHRGDTGESASWAGPVDFGRDDSLTGLIFIRDARPPGMADGAQGH